LPLLRFQCLFSKIWRLYVVYDRRIMVVLPAILLLISYTGTQTEIRIMLTLIQSPLPPVVAGVTNTLMTKARPGTDIFDVATNWIIAYFSLSMSTNVICSGEHIVYYPIVPQGFSYTCAQNRCNCMADLPCRETDKGLYESLAHHIYHRREQRAICFRCLRGARVLPLWH
jgi:hypothetical protein